MKDKTKNEEIKKPTILGMTVYIAVMVILGLLAIFSRQLAQGVEGPILCIYVAVLPKYIFGLALILAGIDGIVYGIRFFRSEQWITMAASGVQVAALLLFLFFIFPLAVKEGVPAGSTYNIMRALIGVMLLVTVGDFVVEIKKFLKIRNNS